MIPAIANVSFFTLVSFSQTTNLHLVGWSLISFLSLLKQITNIWFLKTTQISEAQKPEMGLSGLKPRCWQGRVSSGRPREQSIYLRAFSSSHWLPATLIPPATPRAPDVFTGSGD